MINNNSFQWKNSYIPSIIQNSWSLQKTSNNIIGNQLLLDVSVTDNSNDIEQKETESANPIKKQWTFTAFYKAFCDFSKNPYIKRGIRRANCKSK